MTRPADITPEVWALATFHAGAAPERQGEREMVARALVAERERAAKFHDAKAQELQTLIAETPGGALYGELLMLLGVHFTSAAAIRKGRS